MSNYKLINYKKWLKSFFNLFSNEPEDRDALIEILRNSEHRNLLDADALLMIEGALHVSEIQVRDIMIPRVQMIIIKYDAAPEDILSVVVESGHSRFPVIGDNNDEIVGILLAKDLLHYFSNPKKDFDIKDMMRATVFIPESKRLNVLLREFRTSRNHMAIVIDEFTGVAGLVLKMLLKKSLVRLKMNMILKKMRQTSILTTMTAILLKP
jgi:magnesium and cobalt transporter